MVKDDNKTPTDEVVEGYADPADFAGDDAYEVEELDVKLSRGRVVRVRGLSRLELMHGGKGTEDNAEIERRMIVDAMIKPRMTLKQVEAWQKKPGSIVDMGLVTLAIRNLSGLGKGADKSDVAAISQ
jgi:hypothetical protein